MVITTYEQRHAAIKILSRIAVSVSVSVQDLGWEAAACYLRNLSTELKATEITVEIFSFTRPLQAHDLAFWKVFQGRNSMQSDSFPKWNFQFIDNWRLFIEYLQFLPT